MTEVFLIVFAGSGTACILSFLLGRYLGMSAAYESLRPTLPSNWPDVPKVSELFHEQGNNP